MPTFVTFPGVQTVRSAVFSFTHGISPSVCTLDINPQPGVIAQTGTLSLVDDGGQLGFADCIIDYASYKRNSQGYIVSLNILDRRWKWRFGRIAGRYNVWLDDSTIKDGTEKTPRELATLCFEAMDEQGFSVDALPIDPRPEVNWDELVPAEALAQLCDLFGCRVMLGLDNKAKVVKAGEGDVLPDGWLREDGEQADAPEMPDGVGIIGAPLRYETNLILEAVGIDSDDDATIKPVDELAYRPAGGWKSDWVPDFENVYVEHGEAARLLARESVWRYYRIVFPVEAWQGVPEQIDDLDHLLVENEIVRTHLMDGVKQNRPAYVWGSWYKSVDDCTNHNFKDYELPWQLDARRGLVIFQQPVFATAAEGKREPAEATMYLTAAVSVRDKNTMALKRYTRERPTFGGLGTNTRWTKRPEIVLGHIQGAPQDQAAVDAEADHHLDAIEDEYRWGVPSRRVYTGLQPIPLDGAIQHVVWSVGGQGFFTTASRNTEQREYTVPFKRRRALEARKFGREFDAAIAKWVEEHRV